MKKKIDALACSAEIAQALKKAAFVTTKCGDKVNTMAIGWGHIGRIWERPVFVAYVRDCRYTREMLDANPEFTVNVPVKGYDKRALAVCGGKSGRDTDKIEEAGLTLVEPELMSAPAIKEFPQNAVYCIVKSRMPPDCRRISADSFIQSRRRITSPTTERSWLRI